MTVEEIRAAAEQRVAQMSPEEYERYAAQAREDLELTETKLFYTLKGEERNRFLRARERLTGTGNRDPRTMSLRELRDRYGDLPENTVYGKKPHVMKIWIFVLLFVVCLTHWIPFAAIAQQSNNPWYDIFMTISVIILLSAPGFFLMIVISAIRNSTMKRRILINSAAAIDKLRLEDETVRVIADQIRQKREEVAQMQEIREAIETRQKQEADFGSLANGKYSAVDRTNAGQNSANDEAPPVMNKTPVRKPVQNVPKLTEAALNDKLRTINADNTENYAPDIKTDDDPAQGGNVFSGIEEAAAYRVSTMTKEQYDTIAAPIREQYDTLTRLETEGFGTGPERQKMLRLYQTASYQTEKMIRELETQSAVQPILDQYGLTESDLYRGTSNLLKDRILKNALIFGGCLVLFITSIVLMGKYGSHYLEFESFLSYILISASGIGLFVFFFKTLIPIIHNAKLNRMIAICRSKGRINRQIENEIKKAVYLKEKERYTERYKNQTLR